MNEWRNIQDVIRSTFKALHDVIKAQGDAVKSLERQIDVSSHSWMSYDKLKSLSTRNPMTSFHSQRRERRHTPTHKRHCSERLTLLT